MIKVAAYARVSTNHSNQEYSFELQSSYWNTKLSNDPNYEYVGLYADKGISGKFANRRPEFMAMIQDALNGKINLIFTKSVQRFARNTEDLLTIVRELKEKGVGVIFEKENINTLNKGSELYLTIAGAIAEEDLSNYSQNVEWTVRDKFKQGENIMGYRLYGYKVIKNSKLIINPVEAKIVKRIFELYAKENYSAYKIASILNEEHIPSPNCTKWGDGNIRYILKNEKYIGDLLLQKTFVEKGIKKKNNGERDMFYVQNSHEAIIDKVLWDKTQKIIERRSNKKLVGYIQKTYPFTGLIECGCCGKKYQHKICNSGTICETEYWSCKNNHKEYKIKSTQIKDAVLKEKFISAYNEFVTKCYYDNDDKEKRLQNLYNEERELNQLYANGWINKDSYQDEINKITKETKEISLLRDVDKSELSTIEVFDEQKLHRFIKKVTIYKWVVTFEFYNGVVIERKYTNRKERNI